MTGFTIRLLENVAQSTVFSTVYLAKDFIDRDGFWIRLLGFKLSNRTVIPATTTCTVQEKPATPKKTVQVLLGSRPHIIASIKNKRKGKITNEFCNQSSPVVSF